jgi:DNA (cytosine-5)-methyltransferase 1
MEDLELCSGELDLLAGCPPCQGFSRLRTKNRRSALDPRNDLIEDFVRFARALRPKTIMLENVPGLQRNRRYSALVSDLRALGYNCVTSVLNVADYGVAQRRRRLILLASRVHVPRLGPKSKKAKTVATAIRHLERPSGSKDRLHSMPENRSATVREIIRHIPKNGGSRAQLPARLRLDCHSRSDGFADVYGRMSWNSAAPTITSGCINPSKGRFLHPSQNRTITLREAALLQGFPRRYSFDAEHGKEAIALMVGNALPPPFAAVHARSLLKGIVDSANER